MKTLLNKITNVDFMFNAVKFTFLAIIAFTVVNLLIHWVVSPSVVFNASFGSF